MNRYSLLFIIAVLLADITLIIFKRRVKRNWFLVGLIAVPLMSYVIFYNYDYSLIESGFIYLISFLGVLATTYLFFFLVSYKESTQPVVVSRPVIKAILFFLVQGASLAFILSIPWALSTFPLSNTEAILFTFFAPAEGAFAFVFKTFVDKVLYGNIALFIIYFPSQILICFAMHKSKTDITFHLKPFSLTLPGNSSFPTTFSQLEKGLSTFLLACVFANLALIPAILYSRAFEALLFMEPVNSELYKSQFIKPERIGVHDPTNNKNLIVIFVESMENNFENYTPEINYWKKQGMNFMPGGESVAGTSWTIAGMTAALCGVPVNLPLDITEYHGKLPSFLPGTTCIMELLEKSGYNQIYLQGSSAEFTQKRDFWTYHGNVEIVDDSIIKHKLHLPNNYHVFWGVEDRRTFAVTKQKLDSLAVLEAPFASYVLTVNTHQPDGLLDSACHYEENSPYKNALRCSSKQLGDFLQWVKEQSWFANTIVLLAGDHVMQMLSPKVGLPNDEPLYTTVFFLNAPDGDYKANRSFSNLDLAPSILEALGWELPEHGFALGRSLFANEPTMLELYGRDSLDKMLRQRSFQYDSLLYNK